MEVEPSAFAQDEARRKQADAAAELRRSFERNRQIQSQVTGPDTTALLAQRDKERAAQGREHRAKGDTEKGQRPDQLRVAVNSPHTASVSGSNIALNIRAQQQPVGTGGGLTSGAANFPFRIIDASTGGTNKVKVYKDSHIYTSTDLSSPVTPTNLDTATTVSTGNKVYLEETVNSSGAITASAVVIGSSWTGYGAMFRVDTSGTPYVDRVRVLIAEIAGVADTRDGKTLSGDSTLKVIQHRRTHLIFLSRYDDSGYPVRMPFAL